MSVIGLKTHQFNHTLLDSNYRKTCLQNGISVVSEEIPYVRSISIGVWINVGSRDEPEGKNGIAHFVEHMVFKGTKHYNMQEIARSLESVGGYLNAFTTKEHTCYYARIPDEYLCKSISILSDLVLYPLFDPKEIEKEKVVVLEEIKNIEDDPDDLIHDYFDRVIFRNNSLGNPVIGTPENIKQFQQSDLFDFISKNYVYPKMIISAAGNLQHDQLVQFVEKYFKVNNHYSEQLPRPIWHHKNQPTSMVYEKPITQAHICMGNLTFSVKSPNRYALLVLNTLLGEGMSSRLFQNIRERYGFAYNIYSFVNFLSDTGNFGIYSAFDPCNTERVIELINRELEKLVKKPISNSELARTKAQLKGSTMLSLENMSNRMMRLGLNELYFGEYQPLDEIIKQIDLVNQDQLMEIAHKIFRIENFSSVTIKPVDKSR